MKAKKIFWGIFFILAAAFVILSQMGILPSVSIFTVVITLLLVPVFIESVLHPGFGGVFFPLAIVGILYAEPLGIENLTPWPILGAALFLSIGFSCLFGHHTHHCDNHFDGMCEDQSEETDGFVNICTRFSGSVKYVTSEHLEKVNIAASFSGVKVYLDGATPANDNVEVKIDASFSGVELYVPKTWRVANKLDCSVGGFDEKGLSCESFTHSVTISGYAKCAGVTLIRV